MTSVPKGSSTSWSWQSLNEPIIIRKTADEIVNNSSILQDDDHLFFAIGANEEWVFEVFLFVSAGSVTAELQVAVIVPTGASLKFGLGAQAYIDVLGSAGIAPYVTASGSALNMDIASGYVASLKGWVLNGATAGTVQVQWAQSTATVEDLTVAQGSFLIAHKLA
jgi:hypothetical protein